MPSPVAEMDVARVAAREQRAGLFAGGALTVVALGLIVFAVVAWARTPAGGRDVVQPVAVSALQAPGARVQAAAGVAAPVARTATDRAAGSAASAGVSRSRRIDHLAMT